ncbi:hypothetical protein Taro_051272 [Colocasia esculenta]|uniref:Uncharacterized protein n=1 Tax=Colocasia esculenta TaxID=4460 RepID=A0A843XG41_COLES|nr:hypothetical protein [Colocasia esculenta]
MVKEETRKGPWTEQEDLQLVFSVRLFGERHWDFIAQVSGLNRTGKSCRLRWVNYLQPGLKRGRMSPDEERLVLELHSRWGNRFLPPHFSISRYNSPRSLLLLLLLVLVVLLLLICSTGIIMCKFSGFSI